MKIITNNAVYLQKYYFNILINSTLVTGKGVPFSMFDIASKKTFNKYGSKDFIKFSKTEQIEFLKEADWILDYNLYTNKSINEIKTEIDSIDLEGDKINEYFSNLNDDQKESQYGYWSVKAKMLGYRRESLVDILNLREKNIDFKENKMLKRILKKIKF